MTYLTHLMKSKYLQPKTYLPSLVFVLSMTIAGLISIQFVNTRDGLVWASFSVLCTFALYNASRDKVNLLYIALFMVVILSSTFLGMLFQLGWQYYCFLFIITFIYYYQFGRGAVFDNGMRFIIILATIGTTMPAITNGLPIAGGLGIITALLVCSLLLHKAHDKNAFNLGLFQNERLTQSGKLIPRALFYSTALFLCMVLPDFFGFEKNYWALITFLMVLPPKTISVVKNSLYRFIGSVLAVLLLYLLFELPNYFDLPINMIRYMILLFFIFAFILPLCFGKSFLLVTFGMTAYSMLVVELAMYWDEPTPALLITRVIETFIGGMMAIIAGLFIKWIRPKMSHIESENSIDSASQVSSDQF